MLLITHHYHQLQTQFYFPTSSQRAADLKYHSLVSSALALILWHLKYICCLCLYQLNMPNLPFAIFQRTTSPMAFPPLIWAPSLKLLKKAELPQCCALPVEIQTQRSRGSRTCFLWISAAATGASNSFAQVDFKMIWFNISKVWICVAYWECCKAAFTSLFPYHFFYSLSPLKAWMFYLSSLWLFAWILFVNFIGQIRTAATLKVTRMLE